MTFLMTYAFLRTLTRGNHCACLVEAVGIETADFVATVLPNGKIEAERAQGRADVGDVANADTLGNLARKVLSSSRHAESRELARAVLELLAHWTRAK